jgi:hypothetical protein
LTFWDIYDTIVRIKDSLMPLDLKAIIFNINRYLSQGQRVVCLGASKIVSVEYVNDTLVAWTTSGGLRATEKDILAIQQEIDKQIDMRSR